MCFNMCGRARGCVLICEGGNKDVFYLFHYSRSPKVSLVVISLTLLCLMLLELWLFV